MAKGNAEAGSRERREPWRKKKPKILYRLELARRKDEKSASPPPR
jgi:hypothetical protein